MGGPSPRKLRHIYVGGREAGHPVMLVVRENATERLRATTPGGFDWGWPSGAKRLAHALLLDLTGRDPPPEIHDTLATEELAHLPWAAFSLTGRELLGWIESRGYTIADWPLANSSSASCRTPCAPPPARATLARTRLALREARARERVSLSVGTRGVGRVNDELAACRRRSSGRRALVEAARGGRPARQATGRTFRPPRPAPSHGGGATTTP